MRSVDADGGVWLTDRLSGDRLELVWTGAGWLAPRPAEWVEEDEEPEPEVEPPDPAVVALIATNRARLAELRLLPAGGVNSLGDLFASVDGRWTIGMMGLGVFSAFVHATIAGADLLPIDGWMQWLGLLPLVGLLCTCTWTPLAMLVAGLGLAIARSARRLARWAARGGRCAPALRVAAGFAATTGVLLLVAGAYWAAPPL